MTVTTMMKRIKKFIGLPKEEKRLFFEALFYLWFAKILLLVLPFKICIQLLKPLQEMDGQTDPASLRKIRNALSRANKLAFWKNICLVKSFAGRFMLQRRKIASVLYLGLQIEKEKETKLNAHAWLVAEDIYITPKGSNRYKEIFSI